MEDNKSSISTTINQLVSCINSNNLYVPWVKFNLYGSESADPVLSIDTSKSDNMFSTIQYNRSTEQTGSFTIVIVFKPYNEIELITNSEDIELYSPNYIEKKIQQCINESDSNSTFPTIKFQYGYQYPEELSNIKSCEYTGMLTDFTTEINDGLIMITLTGYSSTIQVQSYKISTQTYEKKKEDGSAGKDSDLTHLDVLLKETSINFQTIVCDKDDGLQNNQYSSYTRPQEISNKFIDKLPLSDNISNKLKNIVNTAISKSDKKILIICNPSYSKINESLQSISDNIEASSGTAYFDFVKNEVNTMISKIDYEIYGKDSINDISDANRNILYNYSVIDNPKTYIESIGLDVSYEFNIAIEISMLELYDEIKMNSNLEDNVDITFNWLNTDDSIVLGFKPSYKGSVLMSLYSGSKIHKRSVVNNEGNLISTSSINGEPNDASRDNLIKRDNEFIKESSYPYTAELQTIGIPIPIPLLTKFNINPLINDIKHLSAGIYIVKSVTDTIDSSGFITTFSLLKYEKPNSEEKLPDNKVKAIQEMKEKLNNYDKYNNENGNEDNVVIEDGAMNVAGIGTVLNSSTNYDALNKIYNKTGFSEKQKHYLGITNDVYEKVEKDVKDGKLVDNSNLRFPSTTISQK